MVRTAVPVATQAWIACALLTKERPERDAFSVPEIIQRARLASLSQPLQEGTKQHIRQHAVANLRTEAPFRYLYAPKRGKRRLYREGDDYLRSKEAGNTAPPRDETPKEFWPLLDWYHSWSTRPSSSLEHAVRLKPLILEFNDEELLMLRHVAARRGIQVEQAARRATLAWAKSSAGKSKDSFLDLVGAVEGSPDSSDRHDDIYGAA